MPDAIDPGDVTFSVSVYRRLLALHPTGFRREYGPAMVQLFRDQCRDAWSESRGWGLARLWSRALPDLAKTSLTEHWSSLKQRESLLMKMMRASRADPRLRAAFLRVFVAVFLFGLLCSVAVAVWSPRSYSSTTRIEVQRDDAATSMTRTPATNGVLASNPYFFITQDKIIMSYSILTNVIDQLHLQKTLANQLGQPEWTLDETFYSLSKMIHVENTRMTSLIEITVNNPDPRLAAEIANAVAASYRNARLEQWRQTHLGGIWALQTNLAAMDRELRKKQLLVDLVREKLGVSEPDAQTTNKISAEDRLMKILAERAAVLKVDYLEYSNVLFKLNKIPRDRLGSELPLTFSFLNNAELNEKSSHLSLATEVFQSAKQDYGPESAHYKKSLLGLQQAQQDYDEKVEEIVNGIRSRVEEDRDLFQTDEQDEAELKANKQKRLESLLPYYRLKDELENLKHKTRESSRYFDQKVAEVGQPDAGIVIVRDPARPAIRPDSPFARTFLIWAFGGALLALLAGAAAAWLAVMTRRVSRPKMAQS